MHQSESEAKDIRRENVEGGDEERGGDDDDDDDDDDELDPTAPAPCRSPSAWISPCNEFLYFLLRDLPAVLAIAVLTTWVLGGVMNHLGWDAPYEQIHYGNYEGGRR